MGDKKGTPAHMLTVAGGSRRLISDPDGTSLRRALRVAVVVPPLTALAGPVTGQQGAATFAVFGAFALLGLADFGGPTRSRARAYATAAVVGAGLVLLGTAASTSAWSAVAGMVLVAFVSQFAGVFGGHIVAGKTALLLVFMVAVSIQAPAVFAWPRLAGWALAAAGSLAAAMLLWPRHARRRLRRRAAEACGALAVLLADPSPGPDLRLRARALVEEARHAFDAAPPRPAGPARRDRALVDLVIELGRAVEFADRAIRPGDPGAPDAPGGPGGPAGQGGPGVAIPEQQALRRAIVETLEASAGVLTGGPGPPDLGPLDRVRGDYRGALDAWAASRLRAGEQAGSVLEGLTAGAEWRLLSHATLAIAIDAATVAGHVIEEAPSPLPHWKAPRAGAAAWLGRAATTIRTHLRPPSVWFRNSLRAASALGLAVLVTRLIRVDHSFWVVLGTLSVLRSNAMSTGRTALLAIGGTVVGFVVAAGLVWAIGTNRAALWATLTIAVFLAAYVPNAVSFLVGQASFTLFVVVLFDLLELEGWRTGLVRLEDVALGVGVSVVVAVLIWPRGAKGQLRTALAALFRADAACLDAAFGYLLGERSKGEVDRSRLAASTEVERAGAAFDAFLTDRESGMPTTLDLGRVTAAGNDVLLAADAMEAMGLLGYRTEECQECVRRVRRDVGVVVGAFAGLAGELENGRAPPAGGAEAAADTREAVVGCLSAWRGAEGSPLGPTAVGLAVAWFWNVEIARLGGELAEPLASMAAGASSPWWR